MRHDQRYIQQFLTELSLLQYAADCYKCLTNTPEYSLPLPPPKIELSECSKDVIDERILNMRKYLEANPCEHVEVAFYCLLKRSGFNTP